MSTKISVPDNFNSNVSGTESKRTDLPFSHLQIYFINGKPQFASLAETDPVSAFGGWGIKFADADGLEAIMKENGKGPLKGSYEVARVNDKGETRTEFAARSLAIAPIASRVYWSVEKTFNGAKRVVRQDQYEQGARKGMQTIAFLFDRHVAEGKKEAVYEPWGIALITTKGYQVAAFLDAMNQFETATLPARTALGDKKAVPANAFVMNVGTFGKKANFETKGKGDKKSSITPITVFLPSDITTEVVAKWFVGEDVLERMVFTYSASEEWLTLFKKGQEVMNSPEDGYSKPDAPAPVADDYEEPF